MKKLIVLFLLLVTSSAFAYFDNTQGRFISRDPIGYRDGASLYAAYFAQMLTIDPLGLCKQPTCGDKPAYAGGFETLKDAVRAGFAEVMPASSKSEQEAGSIVYLCPVDCKFYYTRPTIGSNRGVDAGGNPPGTYGAGQFHTHPVSGESSPSDSDKTYSNQHGVPVFTLGDKDAKKGSGNSLSKGFGGYPAWAGGGTAEWDPKYGPGAWWQQPIPGKPKPINPITDRTFEDGTDNPPLNTPTNSMWNADGSPKEEIANLPACKGKKDFLGK